MFFCKQKTAYEMRISDWSSDVCSSDLCSAFGRLGPSRRAVRQLRPPSMLTSTRLTVPLPDQARPLITSAPRPWVTGACGLGLVMTDFTSISQVKRRALPLASRSVYFEVSSRWRSEARRVGKGVSVRVDIGGRRIIQKKKKQHLLKQ